MQRMSHTYYSILVHCVFSTKERRIHVPANLQQRLWLYMAGIARLGLLWSHLEDAFFNIEINNLSS
jgi:hypothetical protein